MFLTLKADTPTKPHRTPQHPTHPLSLLPSSPPVAKMPFISSPVVLPANAPSSPTDAQKRRNEDETPRPAEPKRQRIMGGFVDDDEEDEEDEETPKIVFSKMFPPYI